MSTTGLARLAARIDLGSFLLLGEGEAQRNGRRRPSLLASTFEAVAGALYLDLGFRRGQRLGREPATTELVAEAPIVALKSPKSRLQEYTQRRSGDRPSYRLVDASGPDHEKSFRIEVWVDGERLGVGEGPSRRIAETAAAAEAMERCAALAGGRRRGHGPAPGRARGGLGRVRAAPAEPRLLALRLQGFKSFAERTNVEFGPGISAVVGPNGSGKSNLADALRWALGEQGRALRSRKSEDVIWAGSEKRAAQGMADVTLVLDNADGLLPVDFSVLELGRRLYRSGENDYLLNKSGSGCATSSTCSTLPTSPTTRSCSSGRGWSTRRSRCGPRSAGRCSRRSPVSAATSGAGAGPRSSWPSPRRTSPGSRTSSPSCGRRPAGWPPRPSSRRRARRRPRSWPARSSSRCTPAGIEAAARLAVVEADRDRAREEVDRAMAALRGRGGGGGCAGCRAWRAARRSSGNGATTTMPRGPPRQPRQMREARLVSELEAVERDRSRLLDERSAARRGGGRGRRALWPFPSRRRDLDSKRH